MNFLKDWYNYIFFHNPNKLHDWELEELMNNDDPFAYYTTTTTTTTIKKPILSKLRHAMRKS